MNKAVRILHLEDKRADADLVARELKKSPLEFELLWVSNKVDFQNALVDFHPDLILSDHSLPSFTSILALKILKEKKTDIPFILVTATMSDEAAVNLMKEGISDYILKDRMQRLPSAVTNALEKHNNIREKQKYYEEVIRNERLFRAMIEKNADMMTLALPTGELLYASPSLTLILGFTKEEYSAKPAFEFIHPNDLPGLVQQTTELLNNPGASFFRRQRLLHKNGTYRWCEGTITNLLHDQHIGALVSNFRDITEQKKAEEGLKQTAGRLKEAQHLARMGNWEIEMMNNNHVWSEEMYRIFGISEGVSASVEMFLSFIHPDDTVFVTKKVEQAFASLENSFFHFRFIRADGEVRHGYSEYRFEFGSGSESPLRLYGIIQDVTESKVIEEKLIRSETEIRNFAKHLNHVQEEERAQIAREIHDELGQELVGIKIGLSSFLRIAGISGQAVDRVKGMMGEVDNAIQSLRKIATQLRPGILDTLGLIPSIEWLGKEFEKKSGIKCEIKTSINEKMFEKDISICFFRVCQEALTNISKHAQPDKVSICVSQKDNELNMEITDNGKGMSSKKANNPFSMGLLGMSERASNIGGSLLIKSRKNEGTTIHLIAPIR
jgi:PAS domain S-box-containing protein